jgi:peptide deformylase
VPVQNIVQFPDAILRKRAKKVHRVDDYIRRLATDLIETLEATPNGAGLAAPQIGVSLRAIAVKFEDKIRVVINPEIVERSEEEVEGDEGCLSIPGWYGPVMRSQRVTVRGLGRTGKPTKIKAEEWEARIFQHEVDHLDGVLFTDRLTDRSRLHRVETDEEEEELEQEQAIV